MEPRTAGRAVCRQEHRRYAPGARLALSGGGHVPDRLDLAVDLRPETPAQPAVPLRGGQRIRQMGRAGPAAGAGGAYALKRILARYGKGLGDLFKPAPPQPPHVVAIKALEALHNQKLWQNNRHKQYYSGLTDILRTYIAARWGVGAMEMTSDEIIEAMRSEELPDKARMDLTAILRDADLVKFAKATPDGEQNEADYLKAFYFVEETKLVVEEEEPEQPDPMQNQNA